MAHFHDDTTQKTGKNGGPENLKSESKNPSPTGSFKPGCASRRFAALRATPGPIKGVCPSGFALHIIGPAKPVRPRSGRTGGDDRNCLWKSVYNTHS